MNTVEPIHGRSAVLDVLLLAARKLPVDAENVSIELFHVLDPVEDLPAIVIRPESEIIVSRGGYLGGDESTSTGDLPGDQFYHDENGELQIRKGYDPDPLCADQYVEDHFYSIEILASHKNYPVRTIDELQYQLQRSLALTGLDQFWFDGSQPIRDFDDEGHVVRYGRTLQYVQRVSYDALSPNQPTV